MPLYEYRCSKCGSVFEVIQKFSDTPLTTHENCGGAVERLLSAPGLQFKGSGWYVTDYARSSSTRSNGETKAESKSDSKPETKSDSKPATTDPKSESKPAAPSKNTD